MNETRPSQSYSRTENLVRSLFSSFGLLILTTAYGLLSVPLALAYLPLKEFGVWAVVTQVTGYLVLVTSALAGSISRIIVEYKDAELSVVANLERTIQWVSGVQGIVAFLAGCVLCWLIPPLMKLDADSKGILSMLLIGQCAVFALSIATSWISHFLVANQRFDIQHKIQAGMLVFQLFIQWMCFKAGAGVYSFLIASALTGLAAQGLLLRASLMTGSYRRVKGGRFDRSMFRSLFRFGGQLFIQVLGWQLLSGTQLILITRAIGLDAAAIFTTCSKTFQMVQQLVYRPLDFSVPALAEMSARREDERMKARFLEISTVGGVLAVLLCAILAVYNQPFVTWWTAGQVRWSSINDWLFALLIVAYTTSRVHGIMGWVTKDVTKTQYLYFVEGVVLVVFGYLAAKVYGSAGLLAVSILCNLLISGGFGFRATRAKFGIPLKSLFAAIWLRPLVLAAVFAPLAWGVGALLRDLSIHMQLFVIPAILVPLGLSFAWWVGLDHKMRGMLAPLVINAIRKRRRS